MEPIFRLPPDIVREAVRVAALAETFDWSLKLFGISELWKQTDGKGVKVAVLDTGCDFDHPDLFEAIDATADFTGSLFGAMDQNGHGTWCCGMIGARANQVGVRGIAPECRLLVGKVLGDDGSGNERSIIRGLEWAAEQGADIVSMSLGGPQMSDRVRSAITAFLSARERFILCAAGNDGRANSVNYPAVWPETVAVAAVDEQRRLTAFSSRGPEVDIAGPGANMLSTVPRTAGSYARMSGTSMATPFVAGVVALMLAKHRQGGGKTPLRSQDDLLEHLRKTATDAGPPGRDDGYGWGLIDPQKLADQMDAPPGQAEPAKPEIELTVKDSQGLKWHAKAIEWEAVN